MGMGSVSAGQSDRPWTSRRCQGSRPPSDGDNDDLVVPTPVGLERDSQVLIKPFCPPYYRTMEEAVLAFIDYKYAEARGTFRDGGRATAWKDGAAVQAGIPRYSDKADPEFYARHYRPDVLTETHHRHQTTWH